MLTARRKIILFALVALVAGLALQLGLKAFNRIDLTKLQATVYPTPRHLPNFNLVDYNNKPFTNNSLKKHWTMMFFGYTYCPDICPTALGVLNQMRGELGERGKQLEVVFVSIDPARDTPARLKEYVPYFNSAFLGVTGSEANLRKLTGFLGIVHLKVPGSDKTLKAEENYMIDHSGAIVLFNPDGDVQAIFGNARSPGLLAKEFILIKKHSEA